MGITRVVIEGSNLSGKSSIAQELEKKYVHSVAVTFHGYYHPEFLRTVQNGEGAATYHRNRLNGFLEALQHVRAEELIFNRFHLTASVYLKLFYGIEEHFYDIEEKMNKLGVILVFADVNKAALEQRLAERKVSGKEAPWGDNSFAMVHEKCEWYRFFFETSKLENKVTVDTSNLMASQAASEVFKKIKT